MILKSFRYQLLFILIAFIAVNLATAYLTSEYYRFRENLNHVKDELFQLEILFLKSIQKQEDFFNFDQINEDYYKFGNSAYIKSHDELISDINHQIVSLSTNDLLSDSSKALLLNLHRAFTKYQKDFIQIVNAINDRGFKNYGMIGEMRNSVHEVENQAIIPQEMLLMLRRHEKDFLLRQDTVYVTKHQELLSDLIQTIDNYISSEPFKDKISSLLLDYGLQFQRVADQEVLIGTKTNQGLKKNLNTNTVQITSAFRLLNDQIGSYQADKTKQLNVYITTFWIVFLFLSLLISFHISKKFTRNVIAMSNHINYFVNTNFTARLNTKLNTGKDEIAALWNNITLMENEIVDYIELFKEKVNEKTLELSFQNEKIEKQKKLLEIQKTELENKNDDLLAGMKYGWRIQRALLPTNKLLSRNLKQAFVYFLPKDIVSGDVFYTQKFRSKYGNESIFSVIDCTGHGVPGAFMSILAINALNNAVIKPKHREPHFILQEANNFIYNALRYYINDLNGVNNKDGMDMIICNLCRETMTLKYEGAHRPLYILRQQSEHVDNNIGLEPDQYQLKHFDTITLIEVFPSKHTVGTISPFKANNFELKQINVKEGDHLYLTTDGYSDQFGGPKGKKFMTKRFKKLICNLVDKPLEEQKDQIEQTFLNWKGDEDQVDDVCVMALKV